MEYNLMVLLENITSKMKNYDMHSITYAQQVKKVFLHSIERGWKVQNSNIATFLFLYPINFFLQKAYIYESIKKMTYIL
jgi:hypothetical protein